MMSDVLQIGVAIDTTGATTTDAGGLPMRKRPMIRSSLPGRPCGVACRP
jgi:hypothetical protein